MTKEKQNNAMPSKGIRLRVDQWEDCDRFSETLKMASRNDFIRDAIDFYLEYLRRNNSVKFLTPALESDSEERLARLLFKLAVDQNLLAHAVADCFEFTPAEVDNMRNDSVREVKETSGTIRTDEILNTKR